MKKSLIMIAAALFIFAGCQKEDSGKEFKTSNVIHIGVKQIAPPTKVAADDITANEVSFHWEEGDQVAFINLDNTDIIITYTCTNPATGEFSGAPLDQGVMYAAVYPASLGTNIDGGLTEIYRENQISKEHPVFNLSVQGSETSFILDKHRTIIHFKLKGSATIGSIKATIPSSEWHTLECPNGIQLNSETATEFYMDAPIILDEEDQWLPATCEVQIFGTEDKNNPLLTKEFTLNAADQYKIIDFAEALIVNAE